MIASLISTNDHKLLHESNLNVSVTISHTAFNLANSAT